MSLWLAKTVSGGRRGGTAAMLGTNVGCLCHTIFAAVGLSAILAASATAFSVIKIVGALYLAWLAIDADPAPARRSMSGRSPRRDPVPADIPVGPGDQPDQSEGGALLPDLPAAIRGGARPRRLAASSCSSACSFIAVNIPLSFMLILGAERVIGWLKAQPGVLRGSTTPSRACSASSPSRS